MSGYAEEMRIADERTFARGAQSGERDKWKILRKGLCPRVV